MILAFVFSRPPSIEQQQDSWIALSESDTSPQEVSVVKPELEANNLFIESTGTVVFRNTVTLSPLVTGRVVWVSDSLLAGNSFEKDEPLLRIDSVSYELSVEQAKANLLIAQANLDLREAERFASSENWALLHPGEDVPDLVSRAPQIAQSKANIKAAETSLDIAELQLARTKFSLPFAGKVLAADVGVGQLVTAGQPFGSVFETDSLEVHCNVSDAELKVLEPVIGRSAIVSKGSETIQAHVERSSAVVDQRNRTIKLYLRLDSPATLLPGQFVDINIAGREVSNTFRIPSTAIQPQTGVWIVKDGLLKSVQPNIISHRYPDVIMEAFDFGEGIVIDQLTNAFEGMPVTIPANQT